MNIILLQYIIDPNEGTFEMSDYSLSVSQFQDVVLDTTTRNRPLFYDPVRFKVAQVLFRSVQLD